MTVAELDPDPREEPFAPADYAAPTSVDAALALLAAYGEDAKIVAGGQSLLVFLRQGLIAPRLLIGLKRIPELTELEATPEGGLTIGAMVTQHALATSPLVRGRFPALSEAAAVIASPQVRRQGTLGGNLCHADPTGDPPAALIALGAEIEVAGPGGRRIPVEAFFRDYMETEIEPGELLVAVHVPASPRRFGSAYLKHRLREIDTAIVGAGIGLALAEDGRTCVEARIGLVGVGVTPIRARGAEDVLVGQVLSNDLLRAAGRAAAAECSPLSDTEASEWYRRQMIEVVLRRAAKVALRRANGDETG